MDSFSTYILLYSIGLVTLAPIYYYMAITRRRKFENDDTTEEQVLTGYYFRQLSPKIRLDLKPQKVKLTDVVGLMNVSADLFFESIDSDFWIRTAEYGPNNQQKCDEHLTYMVGFTEMVIIMEYEISQYLIALGDRDDTEILNNTVINDSVDVMLFTSCYRTFEQQLNLIDRDKAEKLEAYCKAELRFMERKYSNIVYLNNDTIGIRRKN